MKPIFENIKSSTKLLMQSPKDFLFSFSYSDSDLIMVKPFNPKTYKSAKKLSSLINKLYPGIKVYLIGSVGLKIDGKGEIDLYATVEKNEIAMAGDAISEKFGEPLKIKKDFVEWNFYYENVLVEIKLTDSDNKHFKEQIRLFNLLKNNKSYLQEYVNLKRSLHLAGEKEYVRKRMEFFNRILSS